MVLHLPNGAGESLGDVLATCAPLQISGTMRFVDSATGTDAGGNTGADKEKPLATLAGAIAVASENDIIILFSGHTETISSALALVQGLSIIGAGASGGLPTVKLTNNQANGSMFTVAADGVMLANIWFEEDAQDNAVSGLIVVSAAGFKMRGCYFELNAFSPSAAVRFNAASNHAYIRSTEFISNGSSITSRPSTAITVASTITDMTLEGVVFSSGEHGFDSDVFNGSSAVTRLRSESTSQLLGANVALHASTVGYHNVQTATGGAQVAW